MLSDSKTATAMKKKGNLIERLESATEGSRELDIAIADALDVERRYFTRSLDAALSLVPEGWSVWGMDYLQGKYGWWVGKSGPVNVQGRHIDIKMALCIAALRARRMTG